jgi:hypothetical protein
MNGINEPIGQMIELWHFACPTCGIQMWLSKRPGCVECPDGSCKTRWIPDTMDGRYERGYKEVVDVP